MMTPREQAARAMLRPEEEVVQSQWSSSSSQTSSSSVTSQTTVTSFRGNKRRRARRLLMTHTMGLQPSSALQLIIESAESVHTHYDMEKSILGKGAFGVVRRGRLKATGAVRAVKAINKKKMGNEQVVIRQEIEIMKMLDHPNLIMLFEVMEDSHDLFLVLEFAGGGSLQDHLKRDTHIPEKTTAVVMQQILRGTQYLHKMCVVHRDLKADNCLLDKVGPLLECYLKIADFGLSCRIAKGMVLTRPAGTPTHMAPEVFAKRYTEVADVWSCGIICYVMLSGYLPFIATTKDALVDKIQNASLEFRSQEWVDLSQKSVQFLLGMLAKSPKKRHSAATALRDSWIVQHQPPVGRVRLPMKVIEDMNKFRRRNRFKQAALHVIASMLPEEEIQEQRKAFIQLDQDGDGFFTVDELREALRSMIFAPPGDEKEKDNTKEVAGDAEDKNGFTYTEFLAATFDMKKALKAGLFEAAFASFDKNKDGSISISELATGKMLGNLTVDEIMSTMEALDVDGNCELDFEEFVRMMRSESNLKLDAE